MPSSNRDNIELLHNITVYIYQYGNSIIYILGNLGNLVSMMIFLKKAWRKNVCVLYFKFLLLINSGYLNSVILGTTFIVGFNINAQDFSVLLCKLLFYVALVLSMLTPTVLVLASIDRLLISSQNVDTRLYSSKRLAYFSIGASTFIWSIFSIHALIKVNIQEIYPSYLICYYDLSGWYLAFFPYSQMIFNCVFCLLMIILSILSYKNVRCIRIVPRQQRQIVRSMTKKDFQLLRCLFVHNIVYITLSILPSLYSIYKTATYDQQRTPEEQAIVDFLNDFLTFVFFSFYAVSFFIFLGVSKAFRHELKRMIGKVFGQQRIPARDDELRQENNRGSNAGVINTIEIPT